MARARCVFGFFVPACRGSIREQNGPKRPDAETDDTEKVYVAMSQRYHDDVETVLPEVVPCCNRSLR